MQPVAGVWDSVLRLPILPRDNLDGLDRMAGQEPRMTASTGISKDWDGVVVIFAHFLRPADTRHS